MPSQPPEPGAVDHLGPSSGPGGRSRRTLGVGLAGAAMIGVAAAGAWGVAQFLDGGTAAAAAVPANALGYVSLDLDPSAAQKLEVAKVLRRFPALEEKVGSGDDLRRWLVEAVLDEAPCDDPAYADDVDRWFGHKVAFAAVPGPDGGEPVPFVAVEVTDEAAAETAVAEIAGCGTDGGSDDLPGTAFVEGFMIVAETDVIATDLVEQVQGGSLADDHDFTRWVDEVGGSGILTGYVSAEASGAMLEHMQRRLDEDGHGHAFPGAGPSSPFGHPDGLRAAVEQFRGGAMALRFDDGTMELELAGSGAPSALAGDGVTGLGDLPATTALALGTDVSDAAAEELLGQLAEVMGQDRVDGLVALAEQQTGLSLPEDLQTLLGDGIAVAVDGSVDLEASLRTGDSDLRMPVGARITGDPDQIAPILERLLAAAGADRRVVVQRGDGVVAFGLDAAHVAVLAEDGGLGDEPRFEAALPEIADSSGALYVDFDAGEWLTDLAAMAGPGELQENLEPLDSLGITGRQDGEVLRATVRLVTD